jgi:hypothetical protein
LVCSIESSDMNGMIQIVINSLVESGCIVEGGCKWLEVDGKVLRGHDSTSRSCLQWMNMTLSVDSQLEATN